MAKMTEIVCYIYIFRASPNLYHCTTLLNTDVPNCYITLEFITIRLRVWHPSVERPPTDLLNVGRSCSKKSVFADVLLSGTRMDVKTIVL